MWNWLVQVQWYILVKWFWWLNLKCYISHLIILLVKRSGNNHHQKRAQCVVSDQWKLFYWRVTHTTSSTKKRAGCNCFTYCVHLDLNRKPLVVTTYLTVCTNQSNPKNLKLIRKDDNSLTLHQYSFVVSISVKPCRYAMLSLCEITDYSLVSGLHSFRLF